MWLILLVVVIVAALLLARTFGCCSPGPVDGRVHGGAPAPSRATAKRRPGAENNIVVDTLNLVYLVCGKLDGRSSIAEAIEKTAPELHRLYSGRVVYVLKDREGGEAGLPTEARDFYWNLAKKHQISIHVATRPTSPPPSWQVRGVDARGAEPLHEKLGRDDFYAAVLARQMGCSVLTEDKMRDLQTLKTEVAPFQAHIFNHWEDFPRVDRVFPGAPEYANLKRPRRVSYPPHLLLAQNSAKKRMPQPPRRKRLQA